MLRVLIRSASVYPRHTFLSRNKINIYLNVPLIYSHVSLHFHHVIWIIIKKIFVIEYIKTDLCSKMVILRAALKPDSY